MPEFTCQQCGASFTLPEDVTQRYPGWTPKQCRACKNGGQQPVEEDLPVAKVLKRHHGGPQDGVFTDGSAHPNPGQGGWGAVYVVGGAIVDQVYGSEPHTTNNRMELTALLHGFDLVPLGTPATVYSDSNLCVRMVNEWARGWAANGWRRKAGPIANLDLVQALYAKAQQRPELRLRWIRAHEGSRWNEYADALSTAYRRSVL
ncbi:MAG: ribonuclease H family protein [Egibacteraceae bacterium]